MGKVGLLLPDEGFSLEMSNYVLSFQSFRYSKRTYNFVTEFGFQNILVGGSVVRNKNFQQQMSSSCKELNCHFLESRAVIAV